MEIPIAIVPVPCLAIGWPSKQVAADVVSPGTFSRIDVKAPEQLAAAEIDASTRTADSGSMVTVKGISSAMAARGPNPGITPRIRPTTVATNMRRRWLPDRTDARQIINLSDRKSVVWGKKGQ